MQFHFHASQSHFHKNGFALRLALKQRHKGTQKWPIVPDLLAWITFDPIFQEKVLEMEQAHPWEISIQDLACPIYCNCPPTGFSE